jgi:hypothetical protein
MDRMLHWSARMSMTTARSCVISPGLSVSVMAKMR